ncbi:hypothetical protein B0H17DRAFT_1145128 [Mycena rosella]|uniref:Uncharacterized protein n=1 Tax=Mycena rosella TaxID=1033263 RepID=A0AAD7CRZ9_MYCRO|nr:hypothetical protein B0H17DRAFT_1145128 [Mycena rosella]
MIAKKPSWFKVGFKEVGTHKDCPISTLVIRKALPGMRANAVTYAVSASVLRVVMLMMSDADADVLAAALDETHICVTDHRDTVPEQVGGWLFDRPPRVVVLLEQHPSDERVRRGRPAIADKFD